MAVVGVWAGLALNWRELLVVGIASVVLMGIALLFLAGGRSYEITLRLDEDRIVAGEGARAEVRVTNPRKRMILPGRIEVPVGEGLAEFSVPLLGAGATALQRIELPGLARGIVDVGPVRAIRGDPIGLIRRTAEFTSSTRLWVHPETTTLPHIAVGSVRDLDGNPSSTIVASDISFHALREYQPGDARHNVHWKSTAKTGTLMVRQYEESRRSSQAVILSLAEEEYSSTGEFELAVSAAASLGLQGLRFGRETQVSVSPLIPDLAALPPRALESIPASSRTALLDATSGLVRSPRAASLVTSAELAGLLVEGMSVAFLISGSRITLPEIHKAALRVPLGVRTVVILCNPLLPPRVNSIGGIEIFGIAIIDDLLQLARRRIL